MNYYLVHTTYLIVFAAVFARQLCIPVPALLFLLSAGALAGSGRLSYPGILVLSVCGSVCADLIWFEAGRLQGKRVLRILCALAHDPGYCIRKARTVFASRGLRLLLIAKFVPGLDGMCPPLAGMAGSPRSKFILYDAGGSALWAGTYITCGFLFAKELDKVERFTSALANAFVLVLGVPLILLLCRKLFLLLRMVRQLRSTQITAEGLKARLDAGGKIGILDLQHFEDDLQDPVAIPGAVRLAPRDVRRRKRITVPDDVLLVLYCRSRNNFVSARVGVMMKKHGIHHLRVLAGGLDAWNSVGFPVTSELAEPEAELERLGVQVIPPWSWNKSITPPDVETPSEASCDRGTR